MAASRMTTRRLMVLVALAGIVLALLARRERLLRQADYHKARSVLIAPQDKVKIVGDQFLVYDAATISMTPRRQWHTEMWFKYHRAARHPWLPVSPDPPEPK
jgi:hypothetical protein